MLAFARFATRFVRRTGPRRCGQWPVSSGKHVDVIQRSATRADRTRRLAALRTHGCEICSTRTKPGGCAGVSKIDLRSLVSDPGRSCGAPRQHNPGDFLWLTRDRPAVDISGTGHRDYADQPENTSECSTGFRTIRNPVDALGVWAPGRCPQLRPGIARARSACISTEHPDSISRIKLVPLLPDVVSLFFYGRISLDDRGSLSGLGGGEMQGSLDCARDDGGFWMERCGCADAFYPIYAFRTRKCAML